MKQFFKNFKTKLGFTSRSHENKVLPHLLTREGDADCGSLANSCQSKIFSQNLATRFIQLETEVSEDSLTITQENIRPDEFQVANDLKYHLKLKYFLKERSIPTAHNMVQDARVWLENQKQAMDNKSKYYIGTESVIEAFKIDEQEIKFRKELKEPDNYDKFYKHNNMNRNVLGKSWFKHNTYGFIQRHLKKDVSHPVFESAGFWRHLVKLPSICVNKVPKGNFVAKLGCHDNNYFYKYFHINLARQQFVYGPCYCNEWDSLTRRHLLNNLDNYKPNLVSTLYNNIPLEFITKTHKLTHNEMLKNMDSLHKKRYQNVFNKINKFGYTNHTGIGQIKAFVKKEKWDIGKLDKPPRLIQYRSFEYLYRLRQYLYPIDKAMISNEKLWKFQVIKTYFLKGLDSTDTAQVLVDSFNNFVDPYIICFDHSKFDGHVTKEMLLLEQKFYLSCNNDRELKWLLKMQLKNKGKTKSGIPYKVTGKRMSGEYNTSLGNTLINVLILDSVLSRCGIDNRRIHCNGDDSVVIISKSDYHKINLKLFEDYNMETNIEDSGQHLSNITFCQSRILKIEDKYKMVRDPIRLISRICYNINDYNNCLERYILSLGLGELACNSGVPMLQALSVRLIFEGNSNRPISIDNRASLLEKYLDIKPISFRTRVQFQDTFNISILEQLEFERDVMAGVDNKIVSQRILKSIKQTKWSIDENKIKEYQQNFPL